MLFHDPFSPVVDDELIVVLRSLKPYIPGQFYQREMPCILELINYITAPIDALFIDGYVDLGAKAGLGRHLYHALRGNISVIGVAKRFFKASTAIEVKRGQSDRPLFVTAAGLEPRVAAKMIEDMHGPFRIPTLLKRADALARGVAPACVRQDARRGVNNRCLTITSSGLARPDSRGKPLR